MFIRKSHILTGLVLAVFICGFSVAKGADYLSVKLLVPVNGFEYEHAKPNGLGFSLAMSYLPVEDSKILLVSGGIKKYFKSQPKGFYVAGYPGIWNLSVTQREPFFRFDPETFSYEIKESQFKGSATFFTLIAAIGWRGAWRHFTVSTEVGGGILSLNNIKTSGIDPWTGSKTTTDWEIFMTTLMPSLQLSLGYAF